MKTETKAKIKAKIGFETVKFTKEEHEAKLKKEQEADNNAK